MRIACWTAEASFAAFSVERRADLDRRGSFDRSSASAAWLGAGSKTLHPSIEAALCEPTCSWLGWPRMKRFGYVSTRGSWFPFSLPFATKDILAPTVKKSSANPCVVQGGRCAGLTENWTQDWGQHGWWDILPFLLVYFEERRVERAKSQGFARHLLTEDLFFRTCSGVS